MNKINHNKNNRNCKLNITLAWFVLTATSMTSSADSSGGRPGTSPQPPFEIPDIAIFRPYANPVCADHMQQSEVEVTNNQHGGTPWYYYTCTFQNNGWCSLGSGHCPEQVCHPYTDWIGPWNNQAVTPPNIAWHYTCVSIGTPYPF